MDVRKRVSYSLFQMNTKCSVMLNVNAHFFGVYIFCHTYLYRWPHDVAIPCREVNPRNACK